MTNPRRSPFVALLDLFIAVDQSPLGVNGIDRRWGWIWSLVLRRKRSAKAPTALEDFWRVISGDGVHCIEWAATDDVAPVQVERLLKRRGVRVWGRSIYGTGDARTYSVNVGYQQTAWADYIVRSAGVVPLVSAQRGKPGTQAPRAWADMKRKARRWGLL